MGLKVEQGTQGLDGPQRAKADAEADLGQEEEKAPPRTDLPPGPATLYAPPTDGLVKWATRRADGAAGKVEAVRQALPSQVKPEPRRQLEQAKLDINSAKQTALTALSPDQRTEFRNGNDDDATAHAAKSVLTKAEAIKESLKDRDTIDPALSKQMDRAIQDLSKASETGRPSKQSSDTMTRAVETFLSSAKTIEGAMEDLSEQSREINETVKELRFLRNRLNAYKIDLKEEGDTIDLTQPPEGKEKEYQKVIDLWGLAAQNGVDLGDPTKLTRDSVTSAVDGINAATGALLNQDKTVSIRFQHLTTSWNACLMWASAMISANRKVIDNIIQRVGH